MIALKRTLGFAKFWSSVEYLHFVLDYNTGEAKLRLSIADQLFKMNILDFIGMFSVFDGSAYLVSPPLFDEKSLEVWENAIANLFVEGKTMGGENPPKFYLTTIGEKPVYPGRGFAQFLHS